jgi:hypothetical protein
MRPPALDYITRLHWEMLLVSGRRDLSVYDIASGEYLRGDAVTVRKAQMEASSQQGGHKKTLNIVQVEVPLLEDVPAFTHTTTTTTASTSATTTSSSSTSSSSAVGTDVLSLAEAVSNMGVGAPVIESPIPLDFSQQRDRLQWISRHLGPGYLHMTPGVVASTPASVLVVVVVVVVVTVRLLVLLIA